MSALFGLIAQVGFDNDHMGGGWGWLVVVAMVVMMGWMMWSMMRGAGSNGHGSSEDLKARYARGELTTEEFKERLQAPR